MTPIQTPKVDVIIVGAGLSGIVSAFKIVEKEKSLQVKVLEATNVLGGRMAETPLGEIGAKWLTEDQYHVHQLLQKLQVQFRRRRIVAPRLKRCWDMDSGLFSTLAKYELTRYIRELELRLHFFKLGHYDFRKKTKSMHKHIHNRLFFSKSRQFMMNFVELICGVDACDVMYMEFMSVCSTCGSIKSLLDLYKYIECSDRLLEISSTKLMEALLENIKYVEILYLCKVRGIHHFKEYVEVHDSEDKIHTADTVILAIPWNSVQDIYITPVIPKEFQRSSPLHVGKRRKVLTSFIAKYDDGHWRISGYCGSFLCNEPFIVGYEYRPEIYAGMVVHEEGMEPSMQSIILDMLAKHFGAEMLEPCEYCQYTFDMNPVLNVPFTTPWNRIIWSSSTVAATRYRGCLGGAVQSGLRAAMNALLLVRPQVVSWQDITEIQRYDALTKHDISAFRLWMSTWNLFNVSYYGIYICGVIAMLQLAFRNHV